MSILRTVIDEYGDTIDTAYSKIVSQSSDNNRDKTNFTYQVRTWKSKEAYEAEKPSMMALNDRFEVMKVDLTSADLAGLYAHLMLQEGYSGGVEI
jgi:hypothetical protein